MASKSSDRTICLLAALVILSAVAVLRLRTIEKPEPLLVEHEHEPVVDEHVGVRWEPLEVRVDKVFERYAKLRKAYGSLSICQKDVPLYTRWLKYAESVTSSRLKISKAVEGIRELVTYMATLDARVNMIELFLFGPLDERVKSPDRDPELPLTDDHSQCVRSSVELFDKHCGPIQSEYGTKHMPTFTKICDNKVDMDAVEEAFKVTCSHRIFEPNSMRKKMEMGIYD